MLGAVVATHVRVLHHSLDPLGVVLASFSIGVFVVLVALVVRRFVPPAAPPSTPA
jgi:hypothetical protein